MTGKTHRAGGMLCSIVGFSLLKANGLLLPDVNEFVQLAVIYPFCMWGSVSSDLDHHWDSCPDKGIPSRIVNGALHIANPIYKKMDESMSASQKRKSLAYSIARLLSARHRSWQTHSDFTLAVVLSLLWAVLNGAIGKGVLGALDVSILALILTGVCLGIIAHFILDIITPEGIWCTPLAVLNALIRKVSGRSGSFFPDKIHLVPKAKFFATGGTWEKGVYWVLNVATIFAVIWLVATTLFPDLWANLTSLIPFEIQFG